MKILVTGNKGFLGKNLVNKLSENHSISGFDRGDNLDCNVDIVIHTACDGDSRGSNDKLIEHTENNLNLFLKVLNESIKCKIKRFIYISSVEAEEEKNLYAIEKRTCEKILKIMAEKYCFDYVIIRPNNMFGKYMDMNNTKRNVIANFIRQILNDEPVNIIGDGNIKKTFTYVGDVVGAVKESLSCDSGIYDLKKGSEMSIYDLEYMIKNLTKTIKWVEKQ